jgi:hypothetical protein
MPLNWNPVKEGLECLPILAALFSNMIFENEVAQTQKSPTREGEAL